MGCGLVSRRLTFTKVGTIFLTSLKPNSSSLKGGLTARRVTMVCFVARDSIVTSAPSGPCAERSLLEIRLDFGVDCRI